MSEDARRRRSNWEVHVKMEQVQEQIREVMIRLDFLTGSLEKLDWKLQQVGDMVAELRQAKS